MSRLRRRQGNSTPAHGSRGGPSTLSCRHAGKVGQRAQHQGQVPDHRQRLGAQGARGCVLCTGVYSASADSARRQREQRSVREGTPDRLQSRKGDGARKSSSPLRCEVRVELVGFDVRVGTFDSLRLIHSEEPRKFMSMNIIKRTKKQSSLNVGFVRTHYSKNDVGLDVESVALCQVIVSGIIIKEFCELFHSSSINTGCHYSSSNVYQPNNVAETEYSYK